MIKEMSHKIFSDNLKMIHFDEIDVCLQSYEQFISTENNIKQKNVSPLSLPISQKQYLRHLTHSP